MNRFFRTLTLLLAVAALVGCGGGGTSTPNPFAGTYSGAWDSPNYPYYGNIAIIIGTNGRLVGEVTDEYTESYDGTVEGQVGSSGRFTAQIQYPGYPASSLSGTVTFSQTGTLVGNATQRLLDGTTIPVVFELERE